MVKHLGLERLISDDMMSRKHEDMKGTWCLPPPLLPKPQMSYCQLCKLPSWLSSSDRRPQ